MADEAEIESIRTDFAVLFIGDVARGARKSADEYYQLYPGFEDVIADELGRLNEAVMAGGMPQPSSAASSPGDWHLGRYRIERELGRGGQGTVYLVWDEKLERRVALKVLKAAWTASDAMVR